MFLVRPVRQRRRRTSTAAVAVASLLLSVYTAPQAGAQTPVDALSSLGDSGIGSIAGSVGRLPVASTAGVLGSVGSSDFPINSGSVRRVGTPTQVDPSITTTEFLGVERYFGPHNEYEYWLIRSAAMKRVVTVEVVPSRVEGPAPVLYMLDGATPAMRTSGWNDHAHIHERMAGEKVHIVTPMSAFASYYSDWEKPDRVLGNHKWETFLTEELPPIIADRLDTNDKAAIAGNSMGAQAAMHLAANHPGLYSGAIGLSGNYSTTDALGYRSVRLTVEGHGGDLDNMWGPRGIERWRYHDTISHAEKLRGTAVYLSTGNGAIGPDDWDYYAGRETTMIFDALLERGIYEGTRAFERALDRAEVPYAIDYHPTGLHNWPTFMRSFADGWNHIRPELQD